MRFKNNTFNCKISGKHSACLNKTNVCNGVPDCLNGFDESNCPERNRFYIRKDAGNINSMNIFNQNNPIENGIIYQWTIEGKLGSLLQLSLNVTDALNDLSVLEIWLGGPTLQDSYRYGTYTESLTEPEIITSNNNFAIIRFAVQENIKQDTLIITWSSDPRCYWKRVPYHPEVNVDYDDTITLNSADNITFCLEKCNSNCSAVTFNKFETVCHLFELAPLPYKSSCCESYVKICPEKPKYLQEMIVTDTFQEVHSTTYPFEYWENIHHSWILTAPPWEIITLQFLDVDIDPQSSIIVYNGRNSTYGILAKLVSGSMPIVLFSSGNTLSIQFMTGPRPVIRRGFFARYRLGCNIYTSTNFIQLQSPGYDVSGSYLPLLNCMWEIRSINYPPAMSLKFDPKFGLKMNQNFLKIYNGTMLNDTAQFTGKGITGNLTPEDMQSFSGIFNLQFVTNSIVSDIGFRATFSARNYCGFLPDLAYGYWENVTGFYSGDSATYKCRENYEYAANDTVHCTGDGFWKPFPACRLKTCPPIYDLADGYWVKLNDSYRAMCNEYRHLNGDPLVVCWDGKWQEVKCEKIPCKYFYMPKYAERITPENVTYYLANSHLRR
ncbi:CUBN [Acanthosepion pharaonis]|uniref:CUBN n=1 Tax=Acanthosepion pharaonis TaxID=158019 RepID=A0A812B4X0_ACAPH|nr:CUBN [Sepia pharaonis]